MANVQPSSVAWAASLPLIQNEEALAGSPWRSYLHSVYGQHAAFTFPIMMNDFNFFYADLIPDECKPKPMKFTKQPFVAGQLLQSIDAWFGPSKVANYYGGTGRFDVVWVYMYTHGSPRRLGRPSRCPHGVWPHVDEIGLPLPDPPIRYSAGFLNHTKVEVTHTCCDGSANGFWFYLAVGSGVYLNLGRTRIFSDYQDAFLAFGLPPTNSGNFSFLLTRARQAEIDTLQFQFRCETTYKY